MGNVARYGNTPYAIAHADIRRRRRKRRAIGAGLITAGVGGGFLFGTKRGRKVLGHAVGKLGRISPGAPKVVGGGLSRLFAKARKVRSGVSSALGTRASNLFNKSMTRWPQQTQKVGMFGLRAANWWRGLKTAARAF